MSIDLAQQQAFLQAILAEPEDDTHRLVYADWLSENGQEERAEFIRVQCELAKTPSCLVEGKVVNWQSSMRACRDVFPDPHDGKGWGPHCEPCRDFVRLRRRESLLLDANTHIWLFDLPPGFRPLLPDDVRNTFHRGFADRVMCTAAEWLQHADTILSVAPIRSVRLTTWPRVYAKGNEAVEFSIRPRFPFPGDGWYEVVAGRDIALECLDAEWPGITFELPPPPAVQLFNRALSGDEVRALYENTVRAGGV